MKKIKICLACGEEFTGKQYPQLDEKGKPIEGLYHCGCMPKTKTEYLKSIKADS